MSFVRENEFFFSIFRRIFFDNEICYGHKVSVKPFVTLDLLYLVLLAFRGILWQSETL